MATLSHFHSLLSLSSRNFSFLDQLHTQNHHPKFHCLGHLHPRRQSYVCTCSISNSRLISSSFLVSSCVYCVFRILFDVVVEFCVSGLVEGRRVMRSSATTFASSLDRLDFRRIMYLLQRSFRSTEGYLFRLFSVIVFELNGIACFETGFIRFLNSCVTVSHLEGGIVG